MRQLHRPGPQKMESIAGNFTYLVALNRTENLKIRLHQHDMYCACVGCLCRHVCLRAKRAPLKAPTVAPPVRPSPSSIGTSRPKIPVAEAKPLGEVKRSWFQRLEVVWIRKHSNFLAGSCYARWWHPLRRKRTAKGVVSSCLAL